MNVVGRVGNLISQGVYSVATPFHPFGGAVDVIVVQQQDGSFRSTPWYVRFGKFQGVLKGVEKFVRISVNGSEANFHMHLDNSGEAYFIKEVESGEESEVIGNLKDSDGVEGELREGGGNDAKGVVDIPRLEHSVSDSGVDRLQEECDSSGIARLERVESDGARRYCDFENPEPSSDVSVELCGFGSNRYECLDSPGMAEPSSDVSVELCEFNRHECLDSPGIAEPSSDVSVELCEFGSNRYECLDSPGIAEPQVSDSEVILVSVDGHVLTAPVLPSEQNIEDVQLSTPQFHLGPGERTEEFHSGDDIWAAEYICKLNASTSDAVPHSVSDANNDKSALDHQLEVREDDGAHVCQSQEAQEISGLEVDLVGENDAEPTSGKKDSVGISGWLQREDIFMSCLALPELTELVNKVVLEEMNSIPGVKNTREFSHSFPAVDHSQHGCLVEFPNTCSSRPYNSGLIGFEECPLSHVEVEVIDGTVTDAKCIASDHNSASLVKDHMGCDSISVHSVSTTKEPEQRNEELCLSTASEELDNSLQGPEPDDNCSETCIVEPEGDISSEVIQTSSGTRFEISLCGEELHAGIGSAAAAEVFEAHRVSVQEFKASASSILKNENLVVKYEEKYLPWKKAAPAVLGMAAFGLDLPIDPQDSIAVESDSRSVHKSDNTGITSTSPSHSWRLWPIPFRRVKTMEHESYSSSEELFVDSESVQSFDTEPISVLRSGIQSPVKQFLRTNVPTSEQIASLNLKDGQNMVTFSFSTRVLGKQQVEAHIYLWKWNARIVISDVDGTITKSDVLGQVMPLVGKDWTQSGVANLFSAIKENGYQLLFLSARAIVQAYLTKNFLFNVKQDGKTLPYGPVVISPDGLFPSLYREVIRRAPHEFKIACLEDIKNLFPSDCNPFYAGFGNRDTDELSYRKIGIPKGKIFIINPKGEVAISHQINVKSYTSLHTLVNDMFPPTSLLEEEDYNEWNFWRMPIPEVD